MNNKTNFLSKPVVRSMDRGGSFVLFERYNDLTTRDLDWVKSLFAFRVRELDNFNIHQKPCFYNAKALHWPEVSYPICCTQNQQRRWYYLFSATVQLDTTWHSTNYISNNRTMIRYANVLQHNNIILIYNDINKCIAIYIVNLGLRKYIYKT